MAGEDGIPPWVTFILDQVRVQFTETNNRIDNLVTRDAFQQEQSRVNEKFDTHGREIGELKAALQAEATARVTAETNLAKAREKEAEDRQKDQANRRWLVFAMIATPFVSAAAVWILGGGLSTVGAG
ncbi:hypothetical protein PBI_DEWDROP_84 [Microbacterium phage Dewdrop]|nr:hypothetical protein PBI_LEAF_84 [Microbacterium phage Leaf]QGZ17452.1 hypothetical protein PBI_DEWDROP_84 [Microbacterium phage Dewdrop]